MIRPYTKSDQEALIALLRRNTPEFFDVSEEKDFVEYLRDDSDHYFVFEEAGQIIGSGGFNPGFDGGETVRISWDIVHPDCQGRGIGRKLILYRIEQIKKDPKVDKIVVRTSQLVYPFYKKLGFQLELITKDFWATGFDLYQMNMEINKTG